MASKAPSIVQNPNWSKAQKLAFERLDAALPVAMGYMSNEIPILDNHTDAMIVDEVGDLKKAKKMFDKAEKAHVERLKARMGAKDSLKGDIYEAKFKGGGRTILNQDACKALIEECNEEGIHLKRLIASIKAGLIDVPENAFLSEEEFNEPDFFTSSAGGRALYVEAM